MPAEVVNLPSTAVAVGPDATELIVSFKLNQRTRDVAVGVLESDSEVVITVEAAWEPVAEASGGIFPYFCYSSAVAALQKPLAGRRVRTIAPATFW